MLNRNLEREWERDLEHMLDRMLQEHTLEDKSLQGQAYDGDKHLAGNNELLQPNNDSLAILDHNYIQEYTLLLLCIHHFARYIHRHIYNQDNMRVQEHMSDQDAL